MAYRHSIKKRNEKKARAKTRQLEPRLVLASLAMAAGIFVCPFGVEATEIIRKDGTAITTETNVYNIDPEKVSDKFAYNRFDKFVLSAGDIANLKFGGADALANLVNSRIDINGTINAIKNNAIGGHLYFLSPDGIAVGATGVINAGQFTGIVPTRTAFDTLYNSANITLDNITGLNSYAIKDKDGKAVGIDVSGQINTHSGVMLGAGIININDGAKIQSTKDLNFTDLVNTGSANAGLTGDLTASAESGGDIILTAKQASDVKDTKTENNAQVPNAIRWRERSTDLSAAVNIGKNVNITSNDGAVKLTAESTSKYEDSTPMTLTGTVMKDLILGDDKTLLDGVVNKLAGKEASANKYLFVNYSNKKNKASVNIGENSDITGKNIDVSATSKVEITQSVAVPASGKDSEGKTVENTSAMPVAAVAISRVYNNADVVIDGNLTATGADANGSGINIAANADTTAALSATAAGGANTSAAVGVAVLSGDTKSKVTVNEGATALTAANGKVSVGSTTGSDIDVNVGAVGVASAVASTVGVANYDTSADVVLNRSVTAGAVDVNAENNITGLKLTVDNTLKSPEGSGGNNTAPAPDDAQQGSGGQQSGNEGQQTGEERSADPTRTLNDAFVNTGDRDGDAQNGVRKVKKSILGTDADSSASGNSNAGSSNQPSAPVFGLGASVGVVSNTNDANVTVGKNAEIKATSVENGPDGSVNVSADTLMTASKDKEDSLQFTVKNAQANSAKVEIGAAVLVSNVKNNANVLLDSDGDKSAQITGNAVSLDAKAGMGSYKVTQKKKDADGNELNETEEVDKTSTLSYTVSTEGKAADETPAAVQLNGSVGVNTLKNNAIVLLGQKSKVDGSEVKLSSDATTNAEGTYGATDNNTTVGIGATVGIQNIRGNSLVMAGKGAEITGTKSLTASANESMDLKNSVQNAGKGDSVGVSGMVALSYGDSNSIVSLDDEANIATGFATITSTNSTNIDNSARSESTGQNGAKAFGIGVGIVNYDVNSIAMVGDNGRGISAPTGSATDAEKAAKKIAEDAILARDVAGTALAGKLGEKTANGAKGSITTGGLVGAAVTTGMIQNDAKAKVVSAPKPGEDENTRTDSQQWGQWSAQGTQGANEARTNTNNLEQDNVTSQNESTAPNASGAAGEASSAANPDEAPMSGGAAPAAGSHESAGASIGAEGSVALTFLGGRTDAVLDNVTVKNESKNETTGAAESAPVAAVSLSATDFLGSITMGGTNTKHSVKEDNSATKVGIGGTFAMNSSKRDVDSLIRNSDLQQALFVSNSASKTGIEVAAGMGTSVGDGDGANINGAGVVYYNRAKQDIHALMLNTNVTGVSVSNQATGTDFQIAGGLAGTKGGGSNTSVGVGGAVAISNLENNLSSGIIGGEITALGLVDVEAQKGTTQINGALAGTKGDYGFEGAFAYGSTKNTTRAYIEDARVTSLGEVNVKAGEIPVIKDDTQLSTDKTNVNNKIDSSIDTNLDGTQKSNVKTDTQLSEETKTNVKTNLKKQANDALETEKKTQEQHKKTLDDAGLDTTGKSYLQEGDEQSSLGLTNDEKNTDGGKIADEAAGDENAAKDELGQNHSLTITAAMGGGWNGKAGAGAGIAYNYVKNDIAADIKDSTVTADTVNGEAASDAKIVSVGAGVAIGGKTFNGAGSGSWNDLKNDTKVTFENNIFTGKNISEKAENTSSIINIAGEVAGGSGSSLGLSLAYNSLNNTTGTYLTGNTVALSDAASLKLATENKSKALAVAGGVNVDATSKGLLGASGTVAINRGASNTESVIDGKTTGGNTTLNNVKALSVTAEDLTKKTTVAGGVSVGGVKVGIGGSVAYTSVGTSGNKEKLRAEINHADITTTDDGTIEVSTKDSKTNGNDTEKSRVTTVGAGIGVEWGKSYFNIQGAAAVSDIYKDSRAGLNNTNINAENADAHPTVGVTADSKSKINTVGAVGNISVNGTVSGTAGVAINRVNQDTTAEMATDNGKTTAVNAGLTQVRATGDADIHSVGVGGTVAVNEYVSFAGSGSYNYIGNNVNALVKNQNLTSDHSVGVVARSDDRLYNFAGAFNIGANTRAGIGAAVGINKITGDTNALVQGGSVAAAGADSITVSRPQDANLFKTDSLDLTTDRTKLSENRQTENKTGIVVDSSATHTLISQMSSGGAAISSSVGVKLDGTVNLNTVEGKTTAKIQNADLNSAENASNVNVNAVDYTNIGSFTGTLSIGAAAAAGVSVGVSANWETLERTTAAEISSSSDKKNIYAKDLTVDAMAKHGSSALSFAAAGAGGKVGVSSGDSIMRHKYNNTVSALLNNTNAVFDGKAEVVAEHLGNSHSQNISASASAGLAAVSAGAGVSVTDDTSTVKSEVKDSDLKAKASESGKNISVLAKNENNWKETLVTASAAVGIGAGLAANVGIHNTTGETAALVTNSNLEAHDVTVNAKDKLTATSTGGVGALGIGGVGVSVALNNINSSVSAQVTDGTLKASNDINVKAEEERSFDSSVTGVAVGGLGVGVNVAVTSINKGINEAQLSSAKDENGNSMGVNATTQNEINVHLNGTTVDGKKYGGVNNAKGALGVNGAKFVGLSASDQDLKDARDMKVSLSPSTNKQGVHTAVSGTLKADNSVNVLAQDTNDISAKNVTVTVGGAAVGVTDAIIHKNYDTDVTMTGATVTGRNVTVEALQGQKNNGSEINVTAVSVGAGLGVGVGYAGIVNNGATDVNISGSTIKSTAGNVTVNAKDDSKSKTDITNVGVSALNVTTTFASVENNANVGVALGGTNNVAAAKAADDDKAVTGNVTIDATKANALEAHTSGVGVGGVNVAVNHATIEDKGNATAKITGTTNVTGATETSGANSFHLGATNDTTAKLSAGNTAVSVLGISTMRGKGVMDMGAEVSVAGGTFNAKTVEFASMLGNDEGRTIEGNVKGHNISVGAVAPDTVRLETTATGKVNVANSTFGENTDLILDNESYVDRKAYIYDVTAGGVAVGNSRAIISGVETLTTTLTGKSGTTNKLNSLQAFAYGENVGKAFADAGGGGLVGYIGSHVDNKSTNTVTSTLGGKWDVAGDVYLIAAQKDETRLTAKEGHGGVIGVGGTSVENTINTTANAAVANGTEITSNRVHVGTLNAVTAGAYDDVDEKGNKDVQTYTLQDHFGGAISGNRLRSLLDITENGTVTIGDNAKITTNKLQEYIAASQNDLTNHASAKGGAAVGVVDAVTENKLTVNNTVDVKGGAALNNEKTASTEDIVLAAYDEHKLNSHAEATVGGVAGVMVSKNLNTMNRTSNVNVAGTIESGSKVGLYAGANTNGVLSNLNADLKAGAYNHTAIPVSSPTVEYNNHADNGRVNVSGTVRSTGDINVIASGGREKIAKDESLFNWVKGGSSTDKKFLSSDAVVAEEAMPKTSKVTVTGSLIAGTADPINLTVTGSVADVLTLTAPNNNANNRVKNGVTQGTFDYANTLGARLDELNKLISAYDGANADNGGTDVMAAYIAERTRIQEDMQRLGLAEKDESGKYVYSNSGRPVYYVEIPDISTSGGNINVTANDFVGTGNLRANSAPGVTITNQSDAYLKLNNIIMGEKGGQITYNGIDNVIPPNVSQGNAKINSINVSKSGASFREIYGVTDGQAANLSVQNTFSGDLKSTITVTEAMKQLMRQEVQNDTSLSEANKTQLLNEINSHNSFTYTAIPDVEVNGKISNFYGQVEINNTKGDIRINGGTQARPTGVFGNSVKLIAANGTIAQDYKDGIVNISGDPEKYLNSYTSYTDNDLINRAEQTMDFEEITVLGMKIRVRKPGSNRSGNAITTYTRPASANTATGYIAGRDVYVSASNVNVNGLIQSGYKNYTATVTDEQLTAAKGRPAGRAAVVQNRTMYKVNEGGAKWNNTEQVFDYEAQVYWDPSTNQLFVEDIDTAGGKVYLTGKIAGTGDGRILAADGAALITVTNNTALDMNVGKVLNNQREGVITIADTAKDTWTEYKRGQTRTITDYANYLKDHASDGDPYAGASVTTNTLSVMQSLTYTPKENQTYNWTKGKTVESVKEYEHFKRYGLWGAVKTQDVSEMKREAKVIREVQGKEYGLPEGAVIRQDSNTNLSGNTLRLDTTSNRLSNYTTTPVTTLKKTGFFGWFRNYYTRWEEGEKVLKTYNYSISASQPITIGLIGAEVGKIDIKSTNNAGGNINLTGNVANSHNGATLTVNSAAGGIFQNDNTTLKSEIVNLTAKEDIKNIHLASIGKIAGQDAEGKNILTDNIKLTAVSNNKGDIDITAVGGLLANQSLPGNVEIVELKSKNGNAAFSKDAALGDVTLTANGNITQSGNGTTVEGRGITLTSKNGGIGTDSQAINIAGSDLVYSTDRYGAQVNASAKDGIYLTEAEAGGDMRVGKIESREGDVTLTVANGGFIDGLQRDDKSGSTEAVDDMVHRWIDAGLIDGEKGANGTYTYKGAYIEGLEKARDDYAANVTAAYDVANGGRTQAQWQTEYDGQKGAVEAIYASAEYGAYLNNKAKYDAFSPEERRQLADSGNSAFKAYADSAVKYAQYSKYDTAEAYLHDTAAYKYSQHANAADYLANDATYTDLKNKAEHPTFEWTKDMMLYAVSDKMVNKDSGSTNQTDGAANVLGHNVTLTSAKAVGTVSDQSTTIKVEDLTGENSIDNMKTLMNAGASDVTVKKDADGNVESFTIKGNMPLGVFLKDKTNQESGAVEKGALNVQAGGNVSVAGRTDTAGEHSAINVGTINATTTGDVRLHSELGIYNALDASQTNITGKNLILTGGKESIGESEKALTVSLSGDLTEARADKNVFIKNMNDSDYLRLGAMLAKDTISLSSEKGFLMSSANSEIADSYINAGKKLEFITNADTGIVGNDENAIRILNDRAPVNIEAKSAYIKGVNNTDVQNGTLVLGTVSTKKEFVAESAGSIAVGREEEKNSAGTVVKEAVEGNIAAGGNATLTAADDLTLDGTVKAGNLENAKKELTLKAVNGSITQTDKGAITADAVNTVNGKSLILENEGNKFNSITVDSGSTADIAGDVRIVDNSDALTVKINQSVAGDAAKKLAGDISVQNLKANGTMTNSGNLTVAGNIDLTAKGNLTQAANTTLTAGKDVTLGSETGSIQVASIAAAAGDVRLDAASGSITQTASGTSGIQTQTVTAVSGTGVDLQGAGNAFDAITVKSADENTPIEGSVSVKDSADKLELDIQPVVKGNITAENTQDDGVLHVVSALDADGNEAGAKGDITLKSGGGLQTDVALAAANDVNLTSTNGDVLINGDVSTGTKPLDLSSSAEYNALVIRAGGSIQEAAGVKIETPVVETFSGEGVSLESEKNTFSTYFANALVDDGEIGGSVKVVTDHDNAVFTVGVNEDIRGDAEFTNLAQDGSLEILAMDNNAIINVRASDDADGNLVLNASKDVNLLGDVDAAQDIVINSANGAFSGLSRGMIAGNDVRVTAGDAVNYIGTIQAANDIDIQVTAPSSENSGIHIGTVPNQSTGSTSLAAGNEVRFDVQGDGNILLDGSIVAGDGDVAANISGEGSVVITGSVESRNQSVSVETGKGDIVIGTDALGDEKTVTANKDVAVKTGEGTITILGTTTATTGDVTMTAGQEEYQSGTDHGNFIIANGGELVAEQGGITLNGRNGDVVITDDIRAGKDLTVDIAGQGNVGFGTNVDVTNDVNISTEKGDIVVGNAVTSTGGNINMTTGEGYIDVQKAVTAEQDLAITTGKGNITIGDNGPNVPTVTAKQNATVGTELGIVTIYGKTEAQQGDVTLYAGSEEYTQAGKEVEIDEEGHVIKGGDGHTIVIDQNGVVKAGRDVNLGALNDDILVTDKIQAGRDVTTAVTGKGRIFFPGQVVDAREEINIALENGDFILNRGNGTRVSVWLENNSELSYLGEILADANGTAAPDVSLTGNYITVGSITKKNGGSTFQFSAIGANGQKYISQEITVDSLRSDTGTQMPSLWSNRGYVHIDEGALKVNDLLAGDKIHLENDQTTVAVYGRTPTKDGEQLVYWNNVGMANSKRRGFDLYTDGKIGTYKAVLIDSGKYYYKLTGDNLSVVDMMRDRVTHERGEYTFDSTQLTEPGRILREPMFFGVESTDVIIRQQSASDEEIVVES